MNPLLAHSSAVGLILTLLSTASCLAITLERERFEREPAVESIDGLLAGRGAGQAAGKMPYANLTEALSELGAPLHVASLAGEAVALVYGWQASTHLRASLSLPLAETLSGSLDFSRRRAQLDGLVLVFDGAGTLRGSRAGKLTDITARLTGDRPIYDDTWWESE